MVTDEQLKIAEQWILDGKTRKLIADELGISAATVNYYFPGGKEGILRRRRMALEGIQANSAMRGDRARVQLADIAHLVSRDLREEGRTLQQSGTIDGIAFTIFKDGSMEADLPEGKARFKSIEGLQKYLETE